LSRRLDDLIADGTVSSEVEREGPDPLQSRRISAPQPRLPLTRALPFPSQPVLRSRVLPLPRCGIDLLDLASSKAHSPDRYEEAWRMPAGVLAVSSGVA
jgi:hypothetical protein